MATAGGVETAELGDLACREGIFSQRNSLLTQVIR
jgi:hypothetical protein